MQSVHDLAAERAAGRGLKPKTASEDIRTLLNGVDLADRLGNVVGRGIGYSFLQSQGFGAHPLGTPRQDDVQSHERQRRDLRLLGMGLS
jgi:hypothetical protein